MEYHLFASPKVPEIVREPTGPVIGEGEKKRRRMVQHPEYRWSQTIPMLVRAMVVAGDTLFIAGPPDVVDEEEAFRHYGDSEMDKALAAQDAAMLGSEGAELWAVSTVDGKKLAELKLEDLPIFDGLIAAGGRVCHLGSGEGSCLDEDADHHRDAAECEERQRLDSRARIQNAVPDEDAAHGDGGPLGHALQEQVQAVGQGRSEQGGLPHHPGPLGLHDRLHRSPRDRPSQQHPEVVPASLAPAIPPG